jgi:AAA+ ATPase superfamily predicted ATPase
MNGKERSPFYPGSPVPVELFVGRSQKIEEVISYVKNSTHGKQENVFLLGSRGIGKSSLASFLRYYVTSEMNMIGIHVFLGRVATLEEMVRHIFERLLKETKEQTWFKNISSFFGKYIKQVGLFGISLSFSPPIDDLKQLVRNFPEALHNLLAEITKEKSGLFIVLDDINGLAGKSDFADWYKSFADEVATHYPKFPVFIMLIGLPERRDSLSDLQPSLMRIFRPVEIDKLSDEEVEQFLTKAFESVDIKIKKEAAEVMVQYSSGLPLLMHEIGDASFWIDTDGSIDLYDAMVGVFKAAEKVGEKYLDPKVYRAIRSERYISILRKLGGVPLLFKKKDIESRLTDDEKKVFHNFLRKMRELGVIEKEREIGSYRFVNEIYPIYISMESSKPKKGRN